MPITHETVKTVSAELYERALKKSPEDVRTALRKAIETERNETGKATLNLMLKSLETAEKKDRLICSDSGIPIYYLNVGTRVRVETDLRKSIAQGFEELVKTIAPPILEHVTNPLTLERGYSGDGVPIVNIDLVYDADYIEMICTPKGLGSGQWADLHVFSFPSMETIQEYVLACVINAGGQICPPGVIGVGIGGAIDTAAKNAKQALLRPITEHNPDQTIADIEKRLLKAVNRTGIGPMGTGGDVTALAVHMNVSAGHGFVPVAVCFECWPGRKKTAKLFENGSVAYID